MVLTSSNIWGASNCGMCRLSYLLIRPHRYPRSSRLLQWMICFDTSSKSYIRLWKEIAHCGHHKQVNSLITHGLFNASLSCQIRSIILQPRVAYFLRGSYNSSLLSLVSSVYCSFPPPLPVPSDCLIARTMKTTPGLFFKTASTFQLKGTNSGRRHLSLRLSALDVCLMCVR